MHIKVNLSLPAIYMKNAIFWDSAPCTYTGLHDVISQKVVPFPDYGSTGIRVVKRIWTQLYTALNISTEFLQHSCASSVEPFVSICNPRLFAHFCSERSTFFWNADGIWLTYMEKRQLCWSFSAMYCRCILHTVLLVVHSYMFYTDLFQWSGYFSLICIVCSCVNKCLLSKALFLPSTFHQLYS
jgi:hypothetical protein